MKKFAGIAVPLIVMVSMVGLMAGCGSSSNTGKSSSSASSATSSTSQNPDYSKSANWLALPSSTAAKKKVDVFYLGGTTYKKLNVSAPNICAINDPQMEAGAKAAFSSSATTFETVGNIYSPYYRQSDASVLRLPQAEQNKVIGGIPTSYGIAAFDYYIKHLTGRGPNRGACFLVRRGSPHESQLGGDAN